MQNFLKREDFPLFIPVFFGIGILYYFYMKAEPDYFLALSVLLFLFFLLLSLTYFLNKFSFILFALFIIAFGFNVALLNANLKNKIYLEDDLGVIWVRGDIKKIENMEHGKRLILGNLDLWQPKRGKFLEEETPKYIRVNIRTEIAEDIYPTTRVSFKANLRSSRLKPVSLGGYDFGKYSYFAEIGAVGFSVSDVEIFKQNETIWGKIFSIRTKVTENITISLQRFFPTEKEIYSIATALLTGEKTAIPKKHLENIRNIGLGHLLAISGLHMTLVMASLFFLIRWLLARFEYLTLHFDIKKIAVCISLIAGIIYLFLAGVPISARRAYIMVGLFFLAILLDRTTRPMQNVAWAALIILFFEPYAVISPSFHMSFAAVIALVAFFEKIKIGQQSNFSKKILYFFFSILLSTIIAGSATAPFAIYHFGHYSNYSVFANLVAIPLTSFWIMPCGIFSLILMPFGFHEYPLFLMGVGIKLLVNYSEMISNLPNATFFIPQYSIFILSMYVFGGLILCFLRNKTRIFGLVIMLSAFCLFLFYEKSAPDFLISGNGKLFAIKKGESLYFSDLRKEKYARSDWMKKFAIKEARKLEKCTENLCTYKIKDRTITVVNDNCDNLEMVDLLVDLSGLCSENNELLFIKKRDLVNNGAHFVWLDKLKMINIRDYTGNRIWHE